MVNDFKSIDSLSFREATDELEKIVKLLESNTLELEDALKYYERGVALLRTLQLRLNNAEQKVEVLLGELDLSASDEERDTTLS